MIHLEKLTYTSSLAGISGADYSIKNAFVPRLRQARPGHRAKKAPLAEGLLFALLRTVRAGTLRSPPSRPRIPHPP